MDENGFRDYHGDPDIAVCLDNLENGRAGLERIFRKYSILTAAYEEIDAGLPIETEVPDGSFGYTAVSISGFLDLMLELESCLARDRDYQDEEFHYMPISLLDAGCGTGRNLHLLSSSGAFPRIDAKGIDIIGAYIAHGERVYGLKGKMEQADCLKFDYSSFDVVYFYRPFSDDKQEEHFETKLIKCLKPGAYIAAPLALSLDDSHRLVSRGESGQIWKKLR